MIHILVLQEPKGILLGERRKWKHSGIKRKCVSKKDYVYYVPVLDTLEALLNNQSLLAEVMVIFYYKFLHCMFVYVCKGGTRAQITFIHYGRLL